MAPCEDVAASQRWAFDSTGSSLYSWQLISANAACQQNSEGISVAGTLEFSTLSSCQAACVAKKGCVAVDFFSETGWCNFYDAPCEHPLTTKDGATSHRALLSPSPASSFAAVEKSLCLDTTDNATLQTCAGGAAQAFASDGGRFKRASDGKCLEVAWCGLEVCPEKRLEAYVCNDASESALRV